MQTFTKIEVAVRALLQAKERYLQADYVSATILAGAGQKIVRDICKSRGIEPTIKTLSNQSGFTVQEIHNLVVDSYNKMKHADTDPDGFVNVSEEEPRALMTLAATDLMRLKEIKSKEIADFTDFVRVIKGQPQQS